MQREELVQRPCSQNDHGKFHELKVKVMLLKGAWPRISICIRVSVKSCLFTNLVLQLKKEWLTQKNFHPE